MNEKIEGRTNRQIAERFGVSEKTVERSLSWGNRAGIIADAEDHLLERLLPKVTRVLEAALNPVVDEKGEIVSHGDVTVALKLYDKIVKGRDSKEKSAQEDELTRFIDARRQRAAELQNTVEGQTLPAAPQMKFLPALDAVLGPEQPEHLEQVEVTVEE